MKVTKELLEAVNSYRNGKTESFNVIYEESVRYLYTCIIKVVGNKEDAQDILQETYTEIVKSIGQLKEPERFLSWAGMIANRKCFAFLKNNKKDVLVQEEEPLFDDLQDDENLIPENVMQDKEKQRLVREMIDNLSEMQKLCIVAYYYNEKKQEEIAEELSIPVNSVKSHLFRAKTKIKEQTLELEKEKGTRLYSVTPLLALLLAEDMADCEIPEELTERILESVSNLMQETDSASKTKKQLSTQKKILITLLIFAAGVCLLFALYHTAAGPNMSDMEDTANTESFEIGQETETAALQAEIENEIAEEKLSKSPEYDFMNEIQIPRYDEYGRADGGVLPVKKDDLWGAIDYNGTEIIPCEYDKVAASPNQNGCTVFGKGEEYFLLDAQGNIIYQGTNQVIASGNMYMLQTGSFADNICTVEYYTPDGTLLFDVETTPLCACLNPFYNGVSTVYGLSENYTDYTDYSIGTLKEDGSISWVKDPRVLEFEQEQAERERKEQDENSTGNGTQFASFNLAAPADTVSNGVYLMISVFPSGTLYLYSESGEKIAEVSLNGMELTGNDIVYRRDEDPSFTTDNQYIGYFHDGDWMYHYGTQMVWVMGEKNVLVDLSRVSGTGSENVDSNIVQAIYDHIQFGDETYWLVQKGEQLGYINHEGEEIAMYDSATKFYQGKALITEEGRAYMIDETFEKIKDMGEADQIRQNGDFFVITKDGENHLYKAE